MHVENKEMPPTKTILFACFFCSWLGPFTATARPTAAHRIWNEATLFYRSPQSAFPSGQVSRKDLEKNLVRSDLEVSYNILWNQKKWKLNPDQILRDIQTSSWVRTKNPIFLFSAASDSSHRIKELREKTNLTVIKTLRHWAMVFDGDHVGWVPFHHLESVSEDFGIFVALTDTFIRPEPSARSGILTTAARGSRWKAVKIVGDWLEIHWDGHRGYLDLSHLGHRSDFATWAFDKTWHPVLYRIGGQLVVGPNAEKVPLSDFKAFVTTPLRALMTETLHQGPVLRSRVQIESLSAIRWAQSFVEGHGSVWWKIEFNSSPAEMESHWVDLKDLLKNKIYSISMDGYESTQGLISSDGVYRSRPGQKWEKIEEFGNENLPVCVHPGGAWYVGSFRSFDNGENFEPYLRWDLITELMQSQLQRPPLFLKILKIEPKMKSFVQVTLDTGYKVLKIRGHIRGDSWQLVRD